MFFFVLKRLLHSASVTSTRFPSAHLRPFKLKMMRLLFSSFSCVAVLEVFCFVVMSEELGEETLTMISNHDNFASKQSKNTTAKLQLAAS